MSTESGDKQERSRERREKLLHAAVELVSEGGIKALTHRAVSARAGLPPAAAGYYFKTSQALLEETLRFQAAFSSAAVAEILSDAVRAGTGLLDMARRIAEAFVRKASWSVTARYEVYLEASRNPALRAVVTEAMAAFERSTVPLLTSLGVREPARAAKVFAAVVDGFALHRLTNPLPPDDEIEMLYRTLVGLVLVHVADDAAIADQVRRVVPPG